MAKKELKDEALAHVSGGIAEVGDDPQAAGRCPYCATLLVKTPSGYVCKDCGSVFDENGRSIFLEKIK